MSANMRRTTWPLPCSLTLCTIAPACAATCAVPSRELLSNTWIAASGSARRKSATTAAIAIASL
jgi:hypothetical protein